MSANPQFRPAYAIRALAVLERHYQTTPAITLLWLIGAQQGIDLSLAPSLYALWEPILSLSWSADAE